MTANRKHLLALALTFGVILPYARADEHLRVYYIGNSLTRNVPLERLQMLFESRGITYEYGMQLGGGHRLEQHLSKRNHGNRPGEGKYNIAQKFGEDDRAFKNFAFDAVVLQPYMSELDEEVDERNQAYVIKSRRNNKKPSPFDPDKFDPSAGVLNFYADGVHMNDQPHNGDDSGTIGSYVAALTIFATLTETSPVGLTAAPYEQFDEKTDVDLVKAFQETVWQVVTDQEE
jgi:hypothetical protein